MIHHLNLIEDLAQAVMILDIEGRYTTYMSTTCRKLLGIAAENEQFTSMELVDIFVYEGEYDSIRNRVLKDVANTERCELNDLIITPHGGKRFRCHLKAGYVDQNKTSIYIILKSIWDIQEVGSYPKIIQEFPEPVIVIALDDALSYKYANTAFHENFSRKGKAFNTYFDKSLYEALNPQKRERYLKIIKENTKKYRNFKLEVDLLDAAGRFRTVDFCGVQIQESANDSDILLYCKLSVLDEKVAQIKELEAEIAFFDTAYQLSHDLLFRLDLKTATIHYYGPVMKGFGLSKIESDFPDFLIERKVIHPQDEEVFLHMAHEMYRGVERQTSFRVHTKEGEHLWHECDYIITRDAKGEPSEAVGVIRNKQEEKNLEEKMNTDPLTGCMTKYAFEIGVSALIHEGKRKHSVFVVDIDNFKSINDNLGHHFGDIVLKEIGEGLREIFRESDSVGRIGGDEFMILIKNTAEEEALENKAKQVLALLNKVYRSNQQAYRISGSVGIAKFPYDGKTFHELYVNGDKALYASKNSGKNTFTFYNPSLSKGTTEIITPMESGNRSLNQSFDHETIADIYSLLYNTHDIEIALEAVLRRLGTRFGLHRTFIYEKSNDGTHFYNTLEWCNNGIEESLEDERRMELDWALHLQKNANDNGIYHCNDIERIELEEGKALIKRKGVKSFLISHVLIDGTLGYIVGCEDFLRPRVWKPVEISTLMYASKIMGQCLELHKLRNPAP